MNVKYPHWYYGDGDGDGGCDCDMPHPYENVSREMDGFSEARFNDRLLSLLGDEILFSVDARIGKRDSFCGTLCYIGCDFIIVNVCLCHKSVSMHVPIRMLRFVAPFKSRH